LGVKSPYWWGNEKTPLMGNRIYSGKYANIVPKNESGESFAKKDFVISYNEKFDDPNFKISDSALRGVLAHELAHIADFQQKSYFGFDIF
jgi:hypothetical protein